MAAISTIIGVAGLAAAGYGQYRSYKQAKENEQRAEEGRAMTEDAIAVGQQGAGLVSEGTKQVEAARRDQDRLNFLRERRRIFREAQIARSQALSRSVYSNAQYGSALPGAYGQIAGRESQQQTALRANYAIGERIFEGNALASEGRSIESRARGMMTQAGVVGAPIADPLGPALTGFGTSLVNNAPTIQNVSQSLFGSSDTYFSGGFMNTVSRSGLFG